jgi:fatty acid desaturase
MTSATQQATPLHESTDDAFFDQVEAEFEAIKQRYRAKLGAKDVKYIKGLRRTSRVSEVLGRGMLWFGHDPITFTLGVLLTWLHRNLESIEIGHNVLHGQYDYFPEIPQFHSHNFKWKAPCDEEGWRREHNGQHHVHTNVYEMDPDLNHGILRMNDKMPWNKYHRWQVPMYLIIGYPTVLYGFDSQNLAFRDKFRAKKFPQGNEGYAPVYPPEGDDKALRLRHLKAVHRVTLKEYVVMPLLALATGYSWFRVALGNLLVDILNNYWISLTIQATHLTEPLQPEDALKHKGRWYLSQLDSTVNFKGSRRMSILWGHLNYQIEHHLYPDIPSHHYPDIAREVKQVCKQYGLPYKCNETWGQAIRNYIGKMWKYSFPPEGGDSTGQTKGQVKGQHA